jgi:hypothetical protein
MDFFARQAIFFASQTDFFVGQAIFFASQTVWFAGQAICFASQMICFVSQMLWFEGQAICLVAQVIRSTITSVGNARHSSPHPCTLIFLGSARTDDWGFCAES